ncbi:MAG TPA: phospholipase D-like domain-containing protein [Terriglobales bacterium]|jgi:cardiolipin synthase A/B|nr:phospholipase D-like domain-containing protein [Terriglobales bacterium]
MPLLLAEATVSTPFLVLAWLAITATAIVIVVALFDPGLRYRVAAANSPDNGSAEFIRTLEALTDAKVNQSANLSVLTNGNLFYEEELEAISGAAQTVCLEAYIFQESEIGKRFVDALTERARAGLRVKVVLDALGSARVGKDYFRDFTSAGGKLAWYNSARWNKLPRFNNRTHRELLVIDGKTGFIGGAGIADQWYKARPRHPRWRDTMVKVVGLPVAHLQATFAENWLEASGELLTGTDYFPELTDSDDQKNAVLVVSSSPTSGGMTHARVLFQLLIASAQKSVHITTPYFLPDKSFSDELVRAVRRGVDVKIVVPGRRSDIYLTRASSRGGYGRLLKAGADIYEYLPAMIHAKVLLIDGVWGVVGSTNCDYRSFGLNDEVNLVVCDSTFVGRLQEDFVADISNSEQITYERWRNRNIVERAPELFGWILERQQ